MSANAEPGTKGWPYRDFATGWYQIGYSDQYPNGTAQTATWLNEELVIFRTESGDLGVLDAYCRHMGAHLGHPGKFGGCVKGEAIQCPWHGWEWNTRGENVRIPYLDSVSKVRIDAKSVIEVDGLVMLWYDYKRRAPSYEWPGLPYKGKRDGYYPIDWKIVGPCRIKPQYPIENSADLHHFPFVHGSALSATFSDYVREGACISNIMTLLFGGGKEKTWLTPNGPVIGEIYNYFYGASLGVCRFEIEGRYCVHMTNVTPIDHEQSMFFSTIAHNKEPGDTGNVPTGVARQMIDAQHLQIKNDFHIWENQKYLVKPLFMGGEELRYADLRRWLDTFYPEEDRVYRDQNPDTNAAGDSA
jgi:3-ketosteroid 9alpha-monooxygenase subunit A